MWKKLTDLLFEEDDVMDEEEIEETVVKKPVKQSKTIKKTETVVEKPIVSETKVVETVVKEEIVEEKPKSLGIVIDELQEIKPVEQKTVEKIKPRVVDTNRPTNLVKPTQRPRVIPSNKPEGKYNYEFTPVISPIFGINEKDVDAVIPTNPNKKKTITDSRIGTVISPMYGIDRDNEPDSIFGKVSPKVNTVSEKEAEEELVNFSLDDILAKRDNESNLDKTKFFKTSELDEFDRTTVFNNHNMSLFDDENE